MRASRCCCRNVSRASAAVGGSSANSAAARWRSVSATAATDARHARHAARRVCDAAAKGGRGAVASRMAATSGASAAGNTCTSNMGTTSGCSHGGRGGGSGAVAAVAAATRRPPAAPATPSNAAAPAVQPSRSSVAASAIMRKDAPMRRTTARPPGGGAVAAQRASIRSAAAADTARLPSGRSTSRSTASRDSTASVSPGTRSTPSSSTTSPASAPATSALWCHTEVVPAAAASGGAVPRYCSRSRVVISAYRENRVGRRPPASARPTALATADLPHPRGPTISTSRPAARERWMPSIRRRKPGVRSRPVAASTAVVRGAKPEGGAGSRAGGKRPEDDSADARDDLSRAARASVGDQPVPPVAGMVGAVAPLRRPPGAVMRAGCGRWEASAIARRAPPSDRHAGMNQYGYSVCSTAPA